MNTFKYCIMQIANRNKVKNHTSFTSTVVTVGHYIKSQYAVVNTIINIRTLKIEYI